tara:strand:- start:186 stop:449 length:264 start_codon:yes stop_codon:yes gene_type:complete
MKPTIRNLNEYLEEVDAFMEPGNFNPDHAQMYIDEIKMELDAYLAIHMDRDRSDLHCPKRKMLSKVKELEARRIELERLKFESEVEV